MQQILLKIYLPISSLFLLKKDNKSLHFSIFRLNNIHYINLNGEHIIEYNKFSNITHITNILDDVKIINNCIGEITIKMCDIDLIEKALTILNNEMKRRVKWYNELAYYILN